MSAEVAFFCVIAIKTQHLFNEAEFHQKVSSCIIGRTILQEPFMFVFRNSALTTENISKLSLYHLMYSCGFLVCLVHIN